VTKPIDPRVLLARIRTQLRRLGVGLAASQDADAGILSIGSLQVDIQSRDVSVEGHPVPLTTMEFDILAILAGNAGSVVKRDDLYTSAMGIQYDGFDRGLDVHVSRIRHKLRRAGFDTSRLKSVRGVGYLLASR
jgi:DNA-binding response OmpR family regulator